MPSKLIPLLLFLLVSLHVEATHLVGASVKYQRISQDKYKVIYILYRDCKGIPLNAPDFIVSCDNGSMPQAINCTRTSIRDVSNKCPKDSFPCSPKNAPSSTEGLEEHIYEGTVDFNLAPFKAIKTSCCKVLFSVSQCCRPGALTTYSPGNFYVEAMIDLCLTGTSGNNSTNIGGTPVLSACCNIPFSYNLGARKDPDSDSLTFDIVAPLNAAGSNETFQGNFTASIPFTPYCPPNPGVINCKALPEAKPPRGFYFDKATGDVVFTPTNCSEVGSIIVKVSEWRKDSKGVMQLVGYTKRDLMLFIKDCSSNPNNPPYFSGTNKYVVCEGSKLCFKVSAKDDPSLPSQTIADTIALDWDTAIANATFTIVDPAAREKEADFCWQTKVGDGSLDPYVFNLTAKDNFCPSPALAARAYFIYVKPKAAAKRIYNKLHFGKMRFEAMPMDTMKVPFGNYTYQFTVRDSTNSGTPLYQSYKRVDSFAFTKPGKYIIEHLINNPPYNCPTVYTDTIVITQQHILHLAEIRSFEIRIYPNPGNGKIRIASGDVDLSSAVIKVFDISGKLVTEARLEDHYADLSSLANGMYVIEVYAGGIKTHQKLIIE